MLAGRFLHLFQALLLLGELRLHVFHFILFLFLVFVPLNTVGDAVAAGVVNGVAGTVDFMLQGRDSLFLRLNLRLPLFGLSVMVSGSGWCVGCS